MDHTTGLCHFQNVLRCNRWLRRCRKSKTLEDRANWKGPAAAQQQRPRSRSHLGAHGKVLAGWQQICEEVNNEAIPITATLIHERTQSYRGKESSRNDKTCDEVKTGDRLTSKIVYVKPLDSDGRHWFGLYGACKRTFQTTELSHAKRT